MELSGLAIILTVHELHLRSWRWLIGSALPREEKWIREMRVLWGKMSLPALNLLSRLSAILSPFIPSTNLIFFIFLLTCLSLMISDDPPALSNMPRHTFTEVFQWYVSHTSVVLCLTCLRWIQDYSNLYTMCTIACSACIYINVGPFVIICVLSQPLRVAYILSRGRYSLWY